jgi:hypothetical protein
MKYYRVKEERNILHKTKRRKANWIGDVLQGTSKTSYVNIYRREERRRKKT